MKILGLTITREKAAPPPALRPVGGAAWAPPYIIREPYTGAWQKNDALVVGDVMAYAPVFACATLIASDVGKLHLGLQEKNAEGIWEDTDNPAWSPVLRRPNRYQNIIKFVEQWITSKLIHGNTYVLKERDARGVVKALYVLNPLRVTPLIATDGSVFYDLGRDDLLGDLDGMTGGRVAVPAREIIHDMMVALYHPLIGVSPIYACGMAATQGLKIQGNSSAFFANGSQPGGILTAPGSISDETALRLKTYWETNFTGVNVGRVAVVGDGLAYEPMTVNPVDADLVNQLKLTAETICSCFHVPPYMIGVGPFPPYNNVEPAVQAYYSQCIQSLLTNFELCLDEGLELPSGFGTAFDIDDLIWMDTATRTKAANDGIGGGALSPDEARFKYFGLGSVEGGDTPYMQAQYYSLKALAQRDKGDPLTVKAPAPPPVVPAAPVDDGADLAAFTASLMTKVAEFEYAT